MLSVIVVVPNQVSYTWRHAFPIQILNLVGIASLIQRTHGDFGASVAFASQSSA
jgi:hypothetical protein